MSTEAVGRTSTAGNWLAYAILTLGVAVFAFGAEGLMLEGVIGGQTFSFEPIK